ncbi:MAG: response regulator [Pirellulaceae bacterium]|nr:response regulator [Pirellulaceae bacterium]
MNLASHTTNAGEQHKILIVDDDPLALELLEFTLTRFGYTVQTASDGQSALDRIRWFSPRFIISDVEMPGMSGIELCKAVRRRPSTQYIYFILLTSNSDPESVVEGLDAGADDYLSKPFRHEELRLRLEGGKRLVMLEGRDMMIFSLAKLAESRDQDTGKHLERMREYSRAIATELMQWGKYEKTIDAQYVELLYLTSPLHDIGKVGIPDAVLLKPGKLTPEEFEIMKRHTIIGGETLMASSQVHPEASFLTMALDIALKHHEKWDGSGYPFGLKHEEIPLCARIVALADVYDALTTKRVYKPAFSHDVACDIIRQSSGQHFDPEIVTAFFNIEQQIQDIQAELDDVQGNVAIVEFSTPPVAIPTSPLAC